MANYNEIENAIFKVIESVSGYANDKIIFANQSGKRPDDSYISILVTPISATGYSRATYANAVSDLDETISNHSEFNVSVNFFRANALLNANNFVNKLQSNSAITAFKDKNLGFVSTSDIINLSEVNKEFWEERAQTDVRIFAVIDSFETVLAIDEANIDGQAESGNSSYNFNINVRN